MNVAQMIKELEKMGFKVDARRRTDGGWIITKINGMSFSGASGNQYAREVLGVELSQARIEQAHFNVNKYIKGSKKPKDKIDEEMEAELKKVQRLWRKNKVGARITKRKLRWHLKEGGRKEAWDYLKKMSRYGQGYAYTENVLYLAKYIEDVAQGCPANYKERVMEVAAAVRSNIETFKEEWIHEIYSFWYEVIGSNYYEAVIERAINSTYNIMKY